MKTGRRVFLGVVLLLVLGGAGTVYFVDSLVAQAVERGGTHALGVDTRLEDASIGLFSGEFRLTELTVSNPPGFERPAFFALRSGRLELPLSTLVEERITIPSLVLEGITLDLERNSKGTNYGVILDNLARFESGEAPPQEEEPDGGGGKSFVLRKLVLRDIRAGVSLVPAGGDLTKLSLAIPEIVVEEIESEMTLAEICVLVVKTVVRAAAGAGSGVLPEELLHDLRSRMDGLEGLARARLASELGKLGEELGPGAEKALKDASEKLGGKLGELLRKKD
jgi:hypothetical protein